MAKFLNLHLKTANTSLRKGFPKSSRNVAHDLIIKAGVSTYFKENFTQCFPRSLPRPSLPPPQFWENVLLRCQCSHSYATSHLVLVILLRMGRLKLCSFLCFRTTPLIVLFCSGTAVTTFTCFEVYWPPDSSFWNCPTMQNPTNKQANKQELLPRRQERRNMKSKCSD